jgi:hypothetical protein
VSDLGVVPTFASGGYDVAHTGRFDHAASTQQTFAAWVCTSSLAQQWVMGKTRNATAFSGIRCNVDGGALAVSAWYRDTGSDNADTDSAGKLTLRVGLGDWVFLVGVRNGTTVTAYKNGVLFNATTNAALGDCDNTGSWGIGHFETTARWQGQITHLCLWPNRALTLTEIRALYAPRTRWELYAPQIRRTYYDLGGEPPAGRTTKNTRSHPLGLSIGMARTLGGQR